MQIRRAAATAREALLQRAADKLKVAKDTLTVRDGVVTSRTGGDKLSYAATDRRATACDQDRPRGAAEGPEGLHDRRHLRAAPRHSRQKSSGPSTSSRTTSCPACCMRVSFIRRAFGATLAKLRRRRLPQDPGLRARGAQGQFPGRSGDQRMGRHQRVDSDRRQVVGLGRTCPTKSQLFEYVRSSKVDRNEVLQTHRRHGRRGAKAGRPNAAGDLRLRDEYARIDRPILRGRRLQGRPSDRLDALAGKPSAASAARHHAAA